MLSGVFGVNRLSLLAARRKRVFCDDSSGWRERETIPPPTMPLELKREMRVIAKELLSRCTDDEQAEAGRCDWITGPTEWNPVDSVPRTSSFGVGLDSSGFPYTPGCRRANRTF